jgi:hypothetical protein
MTVTNAYYNQNRFIYLYAINMGIETYLFNRFFKEGETNRIIYSTTEYAMKKRFNTNEFNSAALPFINYRDIDYIYDNSRSWFQYPQATTGIFVDSISTKIKLVPVKIIYQSTVWWQTDYDMQIGWEKVQFDDATESMIYTDVLLEGELVSFYGLFDFEFAYRPNFEENDWLIKNKIHVSTLNFNFLTVLPNFDFKGKFALTDKVILKFGQMHSIDNLTVLEQKEFLLNHYDQTSTEI